MDDDTHTPSVSDVHLLRWQSLAIARPTSIPSAASTPLLRRRRVPPRWRGVPRPSPVLPLVQPPVALLSGEAAQIAPRLPLLNGARVTEQHCDRFDRRKNRKTQSGEAESEAAFFGGRRSRVPFPQSRYVTLLAQLLEVLGLGLGIRVDVDPPSGQPRLRDRSRPDAWHRNRE